MDILGSRNICIIESKSMSLLAQDVGPKSYSIDLSFEYANSIYMNELDPSLPPEEQKRQEHAKYLVLAKELSELDEGFLFPGVIPLSFKVNESVCRMRRDVVP